MQRFECTEDGASKFWEAAVEGDTLTTRWGKIGTAGQVKSKSFASAAAAEAELAKLIKEKVGKGYVAAGAAAPAAAKASPPEKTKKKKAATVDGPPPFPGVEPKAVKSLVTKLGKARDHYKVLQLLREAHDEDPLALAWYLLEHGLHPTAHHDFFLNALADFGPSFDEAKDARLVARVIEQRRSGTWQSDYVPRLPGWPDSLDLLVFRTIALDPEAFGEDLGVDFVRLRRHMPVPAARQQAVLDALARAAADGYGISGDFPCLDADGQEVQRPLEEVAGALGDWGAALASACKANAWGLVENVRLGLERLSFGELCELLASRESFNIWSDSSNALETWLAIMRTRQDPPQALLSPAPLPEDADRAALVRELFAVVATERLAGKELPPSIDQALAGFKLIRERHASEAVMRALRQLPRERVLAMIRAALPEAWDKAPLAALGAHFDGDLLAEALAGSGYVSPELLGAIGAPAVLQLAQAARATSDDDTRGARYAAMVLAMARAVQDGQPVPAEWDPFIEIGQVDGQPVKSFNHGEALGLVLAALPEDRRDAVLRRADPRQAMSYAQLGSDAFVDAMIAAALERRRLDRSTLERLKGRVLPALIRHIDLARGDAEIMDTLERALSTADYQKVTQAMQGARETPADALARIVAAAQAADGGERTRVYVVEEAQEARSMSCVGGKAPGLADERIPQHDGEPMGHLMTIDFDDVPELRAQHPGAVALALFCPEPESGEYNEDVELVPLTTRAALDADATPITISGLDAPVSVWSDGERPAAVEELRRAIWKAGAHLFGRPFWIQEFDGDDSGLLVQINDGLVPGLNLGDVGSLYVFDTGDAVYHCH